MQNCSARVGELFFLHPYLYDPAVTGLTAEGKSQTRDEVEFAVFLRHVNNP